MSSHSAASPISKPFAFEPFPSIRYRQAADGTIESRRVENQAELDALGDGWADTPAAFAAKTAPAKSDDGAKAGKATGNGKKADSAKSDDGTK